MERTHAVDVCDATSILDYEKVEEKWKEVMSSESVDQSDDCR